MRHLEAVIAGALLAGVASVYLFHLVQIALHGGVFIYEDRAAVLALEIAAAVAILTYGLVLAVRAIVARLRGQSSK